MTINSRVLTITAASAMLIGSVVAASAQQQPTQQQERPKVEGKGPGGYGKGGFGGQRRGMRGGMRGGMEGRGGGMAPGDIMREFRGLDLTQAQRDQLRQIFEASRPSESERQEMRAIGDARRNGTITEAQKARAKDLMEQRRAGMEGIRQQALGVLTAEQRQKLDDRREKMKERREQCKDNPAGCQGPKPRPRG